MKTRQELIELRAKALQAMQAFLLNDPDVAEYIFSCGLNEAYQGSQEAFDLDQEYATGEYEPLAYKLYYATADLEVKNLLTELLYTQYRAKGADDE